MRIAEIVGSYLNDEFVHVAPNNALMQQIATAFTPSGQVKAHWDAPGFGGEQEPEPVRMVPSSVVVPTSASAGEAQAVPKSRLLPTGGSFQTARAVGPDSALGSRDSRWR